MPRFFSEVLESPITPERFAELIMAAAQTSFVRPHELKSMCVSGVNGMIDAILRERPLADKEIERITGLVDALAERIPGGLGIDQRLIKMSIVSELYEGKMPDRVSIAGPMPLTFGRGESVLWIFNQVQSCVMTVDDKKQSPSINPIHTSDRRYFSPQEVGGVHMPKRKLTEKKQGDLVLTNRNIYFLPDENSHLRIPISRIFMLRPYAEGIYVACKPVNERSRGFILDDAWFAANIVGRLAQTAHLTTSSPVAEAEAEQ